MISESPAGVLVQAIYGFKGKNNDEVACDFLLHLYKGFKIICLPL
jgi:hypothetical protein